jgi:hypothetical protein
MNSGNRNRKLSDQEALLAIGESGADCALISWQQSKANPIKMACFIGLWLKVGGDGIRKTAVADEPDPDDK